MLLETCSNFFHMFFYAFNFRHSEFLNCSCVQGPPVTEPWFGRTKILLSVRYGNLSGDSRNKVYFQRLGRPSGKFNKCPELSL